MPREIKIQTFEQYKDSVYNYQIDLSLIDQELNLTSSNATWSTQDGSIVSIGTSAFSSSTASASVTASNVGIATIKLVIDTNSSDQPVFFFKIRVLDPEDPSSSLAFR